MRYLPVGWLYDVLFGAVKVIDSAIVKRYRMRFVNSVLVEVSGVNNIK